MRAILSAACLLLALPVAAQIPSAANAHKRELTRIVQQEFGLSGPVALHAAQIHQESGWRAHVDSHAGAQGLTQFMPSTSRWIAEIYPDLGPAAPYSPTWAMRAMARYNRWHRARLGFAADDCNRWAFALSAYNGGLGWVQRDQRLALADDADPARWWGHVENYTARADWARRENRSYVQRIVHDIQPRYLRAGWHGPHICK